jgi:hypothetical protein
MTVMDRRETPDRAQDALIEAAARDGFALVQYDVYG